MKRCRPLLRFLFKDRCMVGADTRHLNSAARLLSMTMTQKFEAMSCHFCSQFLLFHCVSNVLLLQCKFLFNIFLMLNIWISSFRKLISECISHFRHMHFLLLKDHTLVIQEQTQTSETGTKEVRTGSGCLSSSEKLSQHQGQ